MRVLNGRWTGVVAVVVAAGFVVSLNARADSDVDTEFRDHLERLLTNVEQSARLTREQISANPGAPFLPDLYMQLGELLSQKADALYFLETERRKKPAGAPSSSDAASTEDPSRSEQVTRAVQEAAQVFAMIDHDFPAYAKRPKVELMLAAAHKMLHETAAFRTTAERLFRDFPGTLEAAKARLLLAELYFDIHDYPECLDALAPLLKAPFPYERDAAKYKTALVYLVQEQFRKSLDSLAEVARDPELDAGSHATQEQDILQGGGRLDLKREALKDSIRAYTQLYPHGEQDPVPYYSELAPTEVYFQEVIEALAYRYLSLREIRTGVSLLRVLCERLRKPQRVVRIYVDVFSQLTPQERWGIEPTEVSYVLEDLRAWLTFYQLDPALHAKFETFFEKQVRELGTAAHERARAQRDGRERDELLERASGFYTLYLDYFKGAKFRVKMAMNLADAELLAKRYKECGDTYLRVFQNEYGPREQPEKLIQNSILCLQSEHSEDFYAAVRSRGLLIKSLREYLAYKPSLANDPKIGFALLKAQYEQGSYTTALDGLYAFIRKFRGSPQAAGAGELVLDYYNTRSDLPGLKGAAERLLSLNVADSAFNERLRAMRKQVALKRLYQKVDTASANPDSSRGETYLQAALSSGDDSIKDVALQHALAASRAEGNIAVYLKTAAVLMAQQRDSGTRAALATALGAENLKLTRFYRALWYFTKIASDPAYPAADRDKAWDQAVNLAVTLRDPAEIVRLMRTSLASGRWARTGADIQARATTVLTELMDGGAELPEGVIATLLKGLPNDDLRVSAYRLHRLLSPSVRREVLAEIEIGCAGSGRGVACAWLKVGQLEAPFTQFLQNLRTATPAIAGLDPIAKQLEALTGQYGALEGAGDPQLEMVRLIRLKEVYLSFATFLNRLARKNSDLATLLQQKAGEAQTSATRQRDLCQSIGAQLSTAGISAPATQYCAVGVSGAPTASGSSPGDPTPFAELLHVPLSTALSWRKQDDPTSAVLDGLEKKRFVNAKDPDVMLSLASAYLASGQPNHAIASALLGAASFPEHVGDFEAISTCAARELGLPREASFHLKRASDYSGLRARCPHENRALE